MLLKLAELSGSEIYHAMAQTIVPRPIAWVLSDNGDGSYNLAPFSFFMAITSDPPLLAMSIGHKGSGEKKDTWVNIEARDHFVVHIADRQLAPQVTQSAATLPHGESELSQAGLEVTAFDGFALPRLKRARVAMGCRREQILEIGNDPQALIIGRIEMLFIDDAICERHGQRLTVDQKKLDAIGRLGGNEYALLGDVVTVVRPR